MVCEALNATEYIASPTSLMYGSLFSSTLIPYMVDIMSAPVTLSKTVRPEWRDVCVCKHSLPDVFAVAIRVVQQTSEKIIANHALLGTKRQVPLEAECAICQAPLSAPGRRGLAIGNRN